MIEVLAHRGAWLETRTPKNSFAAIRSAFEAGLGVEIDVRDDACEVVVAHDPVGRSSGDNLSLKKVLALRREMLVHHARLPIALNIKSDGLAPMLIEVYQGEGQLRLLAPSTGSDFVFDCSTPELISYLQAGVRAFTRISELETEAPLRADSQGIWVDAFESNWYDREEVLNWIESSAYGSSSVALVSPELHGRDPLSLWRLVGDVQCDVPSGSLAVCTDRPLEAKVVFNREQTIHEGAKK